MANVSNGYLPAVSIVIPAYNEERYIEKTLVALRESDYPTDLLEIIVVDNASSDNTAQIAHQYADKVLLLEKGNVGAVRNLGARHATAEILIFIDADCIVDQGWIARGVKLLNTDEDCVFGGAYKTGPQANWIERLWLLENPEKPRLQPDLLGGCIFISSVKFINIGGFNEQMTSGEDSDLSSRLRKIGISVRIENSLSVIHLGNPSTLGAFFSRQVWHSENYLVFMRSSIKDYTFWIVLIFAIAFSLSLFFLFSKNFSVSIEMLSITVALAATLSLKRIIITHYHFKRPDELLGIFILDYIYLIARSLGTVKSLKKLKNNNDR
ncbi:glycosyltransferase [Marinobacter sp.]|uniref:glycosyltransferase n=1 Tax=Marinobacter sp. TaxID=50741 RepID=UPI003A8FEB25